MLMNIFVRMQYNFRVNDADIQYLATFAVFDRAFLVWHNGIVLVCGTLAQRTKSKGENFYG